MATALRIASGVFAGLFVWAALLQWNDPDPLAWTAMYVVAASACALAMIRRLWWPFAALVAAIAGVWAAVLATRTVGVVDFARIFDSFEMKGDLRVEEAREMVGLLVIVLVCGGLALYAWRASVQLRGGS